MKIGIMTDLEGVAGVINEADWIHPESRFYEDAKRLLTEEVNAAIRGFCDAGADEIMVIDGHGPGAINSFDLDPRAVYSRGWAVNAQFSLNEGFDAVAWVGQHAKAGTIKSQITHTGGFSILERRLNGISIGEYGEYVFVSGYYGSPVIFASGERAFAAEAKELTPWVHTVEVKYGVCLDNGANLTAEEYACHNNGAVHLHPVVARERIYKGAKEALEDFKANPDKFKPLCPEPPYFQEVWVRKTKDKPAHKLVASHPTSPVALYSVGWEEVPEGTYDQPYPFVKLEQKEGELTPPLK